MKERLQKYIAKCGVTSRRKAEELIFSGRVKVNGSTVNNIVIIDEELDKVEIDDCIIKPQEKIVYIMLNKPAGVITSVKDQFNRKTVVDLIDINERVYPVGRLDYDTSGLIILTNDGEVAQRLTHPSRNINKVYIADVDGIPDENEMDSFRRGLRIEDYITSPAEIRIIKKYEKSSRVEVIIHEGKNRQVRKMCEAIGHPVLCLKRVAMGKIELGELPEGNWRFLNEGEIEYLKSI